MVITLAVPEALQYAIMGQDKERASLRDLIHPTTSPIVCASASMLRLGRHFHGGEDSPWFLIDLLGGDLNDAKLRLSARRSVLQLAAGLQEVFELRLSQPPYRLGWLCIDGVSRVQKEQVVADFFAEPSACQSYMCRRLREMYPTEGAFLDGAPLALQTWLRCTPTAIDFSERAHAQMRHDIRSAGPASSFEAAAARCLCREFAAEHVRRGGKDPALIDLKDMVTASPQSGLQQLAELNGGGGKRRNIGGNGFFEFHNVRMHTHKMLVAPQRPLTKDELQSIEISIGEAWGAMDVETQRLWLARHRSGGQRAIQDQAAAALVDHEGQQFLGLWNSSRDRNFIVEPGALPDFATHRVDRHKLASSSPVVDAPPRCARATSDWGSLFSCKGLKKNVCRIHGMNDVCQRAMNGMTGLINSWVDRLPADARASATELIAFESRAHTGDDAGQMLVIQLLVTTCGKPKCQMFADCGLSIAGSHPLRFHPARPPPYRISVLDRVSRMGGPAREIAISTSDEVAQYLLSLSSDWTLRPLEYDLPEGEDLLAMVVRRHLDAFEKPVSAPRRSSKPKHVYPSVFDLGDPFEYGRGLFQNVPVVDPPPQHTDVREHAADVSDSEHSGMSDHVMLHVDQDFAEDVEDEIGEDIAMPDCHTEDGSIDPNCSSEAEPEEESEEDRRVRAISTAEITNPMGYVKSAVSPWDGVTNVGRITTWPVEMPMERRNVGIRCYMHSNCSITRTRKRFDDEAILKWLFSVAPVPAGSSAAVKAAARASHLEAALVMLPKANAGGAGAPMPAGS